jgi:predicted transcriptional regulator
MSENERYKLALQCNNAAEAVVPSTLVTHAEFIWKRSEEGKTQAEIAEMLGWSRGRVGDYSSLQSISSEAWDIIVGTFDNIPTSADDVAPSQNVGTPTFSETLLRSILHLEADRQFVRRYHCQMVRS